MTKEKNEQYKLHVKLGKCFTCAEEYNMFFKLTHNLNPERVKAILKAIKLTRGCNVI